jgi:hypothetical protein
MTMAFCRGCGKEIHESAPLCPHCGASQTAIGKPPQKSEHPGWMSITSIVIASVALLGSFGLDGNDKDQLVGIALFAVISTVFGAINLQQHKAGKTIAIIAIVLASVALLICLGNFN